MATSDKFKGINLASVRIRIEQHLTRYFKCLGNIQGRLMVGNRGNGWADIQAQILQREGVHVVTDGMGEHHIDLIEFGWFPAHVSTDMTS